MTTVTTALSRRNVEQKFRCANLPTAQASALAAGARLAGTMLQRDVYFNTSAGRLKLRTIRAAGELRSELIAYHRPDSVGERLSEYEIVPVAEPQPLEQALKLTLGIRATVRKRRTLLLDGNLRIHFDEVEHLGCFIEFEAVLEGGADEQAGRERIIHWRELLRLGEAVSESYVDLAEASAQPAADQSTVE